MKINMKKVYNIFALGALALLGYQSIQLRNLEKKYHEGLASLSEKIEQTDNIRGLEREKLLDCFFQSLVTDFSTAIRIHEYRNRF